MASTINAITTGTGGVVTTADATGNLSLQTAGTTVMALTPGAASFTGTLTLNGSSVLSAGSTVTTAQGGTGLSSFTSGGAMYATSTSALTTGTLPIASGGTNNSALAVTAGGVVYTDGTKLVNVGAGSSGQFLKSNGASAPTWATSGLAFQSVQATGFTAVSGNIYPCNTTSAGFTVTLPASPSAGDQIAVIDYAGTFATNNLTISPNGNKIQGLTSNATLSAKRESTTLVYTDATQGWVAISAANESGNASLPQIYTASYLIVAGGGGGAFSGGGGGAGGYITGTTTLSAGTVYTATVGGGGNASTSAGNASAGSPSTFTGLTTSIGGGYGGGGASGGPGGSGGGGAGNTTANVGGSATSGQGNSGAPGVANSSGGGGGASAAGSTGAASNPGGNGGAGSASSITGSPVTYAGGGGGAGQTTGGSGGSGGGGAGGSSPTSNIGVAGTVNTGGGGGGGTQGVGPGTAGAAGGSGVVIISVPTANYSGTTTGSPTITTSGSNTIIKWTTGSGTYTG